MPDRTIMNEISTILDLPLEELYQIKQTKTWVQCFTKEMLYIKKSEEIKFTALSFLCSLIISIILYYLHFFGEPTNDTLYLSMIRDFLASFLFDGMLFLLVLIIGLFVGYRHILKHDQMQLVPLNLGRVFVGSIVLVLSVIEFYVIKVIQFPELSAFGSIFLLTVILYQSTLEMVYTAQVKERK